MLRKKIKKLIIATLLIVSIFISGKYILNNKSIPLFHPNSNKVECKMDMTEFKIKNILAIDKLETLQVEFSTELNSTQYDKSNNKLLDKISKVLTTRKVTMVGDYKAVFSIDLSKAQLSSSPDGTYTITLNTDDIDVDVVTVDSEVTKDGISLIGRYTTAKESIEIKNTLDDMAKKKINTQENREIAKENFKFDLQKMLNKVGLNMDNIIIE